MTSLDSNTKLLKWHPINQVTSYTIVYDQSGFDINNNNANTLQTNDTEIEIQYSSWISYDVYVKANYPNNTSSEWNGPFNSSNNGSSCGAFNLNAYPSQQPNRLYINWGETWQTGFNVNSWTLEYGPTGFNSGNGTIVNASNTSSPPYFIENLEFETEYDIYIKGNCSNNGQSIYTGFITVSTLEACAAPYSFEINQIENNSITVYCDASFNEDVELIYGEAGFNIADGISQTYSNSYIEITGLLPNTTYEFYARTTCANGEVSNLIGPISATTLN